MQRLYLYLITIGVVVSGWLIVTSSVRAASAAPPATYVLVRSYTGPGSSGSAGIYDLASSIGQPAAGEVSAGNYTLGGGFWGGGIMVSAQANYSLFLPLMLK